MIFFLKANKEKNTEGPGYGKIIADPDPIPDTEPDPVPVFPKRKIRTQTKST
jgi:hypothetical protein